MLEKHIDNSQLQKLGIFAVYDVKAARYMSPFTSDNASVAIRQFKEYCGNPQSIFSKNPEDFALHTIGKFDERTGEVIPEKSYMLIQAAQVIAAKG